MHGPKLPGLRVVEEIGLSQAATEGNYDLFENDSFAQFDDANVLIVVAVEQDLGGEVASQENEVSPMVQKEQNEEWETKLSTSTADQLLHPHYVDFMNLAGPNPKVMEYAAMEFCGLIANVQAMKANKQASNIQQQNASDSTSEFASFLEIHMER